MPHNFYIEEVSNSCESCCIHQASDQGIAEESNQKPKQSEGDSGEPAAKKLHGNKRKSVFAVTVFSEDYSDLKGHCCGDFAVFTPQLFKGGIALSSG